MNVERDLERMRRMFVVQAYRYLRDWDDAADAVQNAFVAVHQAIERGAEIPNLSAYAGRCVHHHTVNVIRTRARHPELPLIDEVFGCDPERDTMIRCELEKVPEPMRTVLEARANSYTFREIAQKHGIAKPQAWYLLRRARERFGDYLGAA